MSRPRMPYFSLASTTMERPSGVSSASEASCAASASSCSVTPRTGRKAVACRLPSVMVPVLSSSSVSTSPAASTARPDIASTLKRTRRSMPAMPIADKQRADGGRDQRHEQRHQDHDRDRAAGIGRVARDGHGREHEDDGEAREQDVERDLVRRLLPLGALDQPDHAVDEGRALGCRDAHLDPVGQHLRAAGHRRAVAAGFADHGRGFAGDGGFVDGGDALDHLAVGGDVVAGLDQHDVADLQAGAGDEAIGLAQSLQQLGLALGAGLLQRFGLRLAAAFGDGFGEIGEQHGEPEPEDDLEGEAEIGAAGDEIADEDHGGERGDDLDHEHHGVLDHQPRIELGKGRPDRGHDDLRIQHRRKRPSFFCSFMVSMDVTPNAIRRRCWRSSRGARRSGRAPAPGRR